MHRSIQRPRLRIRPRLFAGPRVRRTLLFAGLAFAALPAGSALASTTVGPLAGGGNGTTSPKSASSSCHGRAVVTGLQVALEGRNLVGSVAVICTAPNGVTHTGRAIGDTGSSPTPASCTGTDVGLGIYGYTGDIIDGVGIRCGPLGGTATDGPLVWGGGGGPNGPYDCPAGSALTGLTGIYAPYVGEDVVVSLTGVCTVPKTH